MTGQSEIAECHRMVTDRAAAALGLGERYGLAVGRPASLLVLPAADGIDVLRRQVRPRYVVANGRLVAENPVADTVLHWPGEAPRSVDFVRDADRAHPPSMPARTHSPMTAVTAVTTTRPRAPQDVLRDASRAADPVAWPDGKSAAATLGFDLDAEAVVLTADPSNAARLSVMTHQAYGPLTGVPRILRLLARHEVRATFFVPGYSAERYPELVRKIVDAGHEIAHHGYLHEAVRGMSPSAEGDMLDRGLDALERVAGLRPTGYRAPMWETTYATASLLADRGFTYDSSLMDSDVPYILAEHDRPGARSLVEIPVHWALDDWEQYAYLPEVFGSGLIESPAKVLEMWSLELRAMSDEGGCFALTNHPFLSGRPARLRALEQLVELMKSLDIWIATADEVARHVRTLDLAPRSFPQPVVE
jgi:peptidoglycan/xylan/chitin deacetylase (PgdA/CDA1 family)